MNMRITDNAYRETSLRDIQRIQRDVVKAHKELITHQRVERPSDDPVAASKALHQTSEKRTLSQYAKNNRVALDAVTESHASLTEFKDTVLTRAQELSILVDDISDGNAKEAYLAELNQLIEHGLQVMNTKHRGEYLFSGDSSLTEPFSAVRSAGGKIISVSYAGSSKARSYDVGEGVHLSPTLDPAQTTQFSTCFANLINLRDAISSGDNNAIDLARSGLLTNETDIVADLSNLGGKQMRIESAKVFDTARYKRLEEGIHGNVDADLAEASTRFKDLSDALDLAFKIHSHATSQSILNYL
tara:strand:- start:805 stop:1707 length:903 start_codon:yes stop_codon:yes gene_type:complete